MRAVRVMGRYEQTHREVTRMDTNRYAVADFDNYIAAFDKTVSTIPDEPAFSAGADVKQVPSQPHKIPSHGHIHCFVLAKTLQLIKTIVSILKSN